MGNSKRTTSATIWIVTLGSLLWSIGAIATGIWQSLQLEREMAQNNQQVADFARVPNVTTGVYDYGGSTAWASLRLAVDSAIQSERPEIQLRYVQPPNEPPGSSPGMKMLLEGKVAFVQSADALSPQEYRLAERQGLNLQQVPVAVNSIAVAVHPDLDLPGLTLKQLQAIYTGEISNWQELGGVDLPITAYSRPASAGGTVDLFVERVLQNKKLGSKVKFVPTTTKALRQLARDPGGIYYGSAPAIVPQCTVKPLPLADEGSNFVAPYQLPLVPASDCPSKRNQLNLKALGTARYPLTHYLYVVYLEDEARSYIGKTYANFLLTPQGQKSIAEVGFIPLNWF